MARGERKYRWPRKNIFKPLLLSSVAHFLFSRFLNKGFKTRPTRRLAVDYNIFQSMPYPALNEPLSLESWLQIRHHVSNHANHCVCLQYSGIASAVQRRRTSLSFMGTKEMTIWCIQMGAVRCKAISSSPLLVSFSRPFLFRVPPCLRAANGAKWQHQPEEESVRKARTPPASQSNKALGIVTWRDMAHIPQHIFVSFCNSCGGWTPIEPMLHLFWCSPPGKPRARRALHTRTQQVRLWKERPCDTLVQSFSQECS